MGVASELAAICYFGHGEKLMVSGLASVKQVSSVL